MFFFIFVNVPLLFIAVSSFTAKLLYSQSVMRQKCLRQRRLQLKVLRAHPCMAAMAEAKRRLSSVDRLVLCFTSLHHSLLPSALPASHIPVNHSALGGMWNCDPCFMDSMLGLSDDFFYGLSHLVKSKPS